MKTQFLDQLETSQDVFSHLWETGKLTIERFCEIYRAEKQQSGERVKPLDLYIFWAYNA